MLLKTYKSALSDKAPQFVMVREEQHWNLGGVDAHTATCIHAHGAFKRADREAVANMRYLLNRRGCPAGSLMCGTWQCSSCVGRQQLNLEYQLTGSPAWVV